MEWFIDLCSLTSQNGVLVSTSRSNKTGSMYVIHAGPDGISKPPTPPYIDNETTRSLTKKRKILAFQYFPGVDLPMDKHYPCLQT